MLTKFTTHHYLMVACFAVLMLINGACKKEQISADPTQAPVGIVETERLLLASSHVPKISDIEYNADKTLKGYKDNGSDQVDIVYKSDSVIYNFSRKKWGGRKVYKLENHLVTSMTSYVVDKGIELENFTLTYLYKNGKVYKEIASQKGKIFAYALHFYDSTNQNLISREDYNQEGVLQNKITFEYTDILNKSIFLNEWSSMSPDGALFPKSAKYLAKKCVSVDQVNHATVISTFTYELDQSGYVISCKMSNDNGVESSWTNKWE